MDREKREEKIGFGQKKYLMSDQFSGTNSLIFFFF
jgi:hypothetical protein